MTNIGSTSLKSKVASQTRLNARALIDFEAGDLVYAQAQHLQQ
jgi:hypothetical protein